MHTCAHCPSLHADDDSAAQHAPCPTPSQCAWCEPAVEHALRQHAEATLQLAADAAHSLRAAHSQAAVVSALAPQLAAPEHAHTPVASCPHSMGGALLAIASLGALSSVS
ncbi:hypothetical protein EON67_06705, partial [archaeon]